MTPTDRATGDGDPFDSLLNLEDQFYKEGYENGLKDGERAGHLEGRAFGIEKGFEKFIDMGRMHGRATVWSSRLTGWDEKLKSSKETTRASAQEPPHSKVQTLGQLSNAKLGSHVRTLYALTEPESLSTENSEDAIADFDDRLKRATGKSKIVERMLHESSSEAAGDLPHSNTTKKALSRDEESIEDVGNMGAILSA